MRRVNYYLVIVLLSCLPLISLFATSQLIHTHDGLVHLPRIAAYFKALGDGQFPVRFAGELNHGYGMPLFNFMYQVPYLVASFFLLLGAGLVLSFKLSLSVSYLLSGIFMFAFADAYFKDKKIALLVTVFYQFTTFRFVELLIRASFGEVYTYTFLPLVLFAVVKYLNTQGLRYFVLIIVSVALLVLSHNAISLVFFAIIFFFALFYASTVQKKLSVLCALFLGLTLSAFYWLPAVLEHKYTYGDLFMKNLYKDHFVPIQNFFIPNIFNSKNLQTEGISVQFGLLPTLALLVSLWALFTQKLDKHIKKILLFCFAILLVALFFMQPVSKPLWENISLLRQFQFPWRFLAIAVFATSIFAIGFTIPKILQKKWIYILIIALTVLSSAWYWKPALGLDTIDEKYYWDFPLNTTYYGETDVIWSEGPAKSYPKQRLEVIAGKGIIKPIMRKSQVHTFTVIAKTPVQIVDKTQYFPGWRVLVNSKTIPIEFQDPNWRGQITFPLPQGTHLVKVVFLETPLRMVADIISLITLCGILGLVVIKRKQL